MNRKNDNLCTFQIAYWTGYFTSRPALKGYERELNSLLHSAERMFTLAPVTVKDPSYLDNLEQFGRAVALTQHHDAVS